MSSASLQPSWDRRVMSSASLQPTAHCFLQIRHYLLDEDYKVTPTGLALLFISYTSASCCSHTGLLSYPSASFCSHTGLLSYPSASCCSHTGLLSYPSASCCSHTGLLSYPSASCCSHTGLLSYPSAETSWPKDGTPRKMSTLLSVQFVRLF